MTTEPPTFQVLRPCYRVTCVKCCIDFDRRHAWRYKLYEDPVGFYVYACPACEGEVYGLRVHLGIEDLWTATIPDLAGFMRSVCGAVKGTRPTAIEGPIYEYPCGLSISHRLIETTTPEVLIAIRDGHERHHAAGHGYSHGGPQWALESQMVRGAPAIYCPGETPG